MESSFRSAINVSFRITITVSHHSGWDTKLVDLDDGVLRFWSCASLGQEPSQNRKVAKVIFSKHS